MALPGDSLESKLNLAAKSQPPSPLCSLSQEPSNTGVEAFQPSPSWQLIRASALSSWNPRATRVGWSLLLQ